MTKTEIADVLGEIATLLELQGENPFKVRAYQVGARAVEAIEEAELRRLVDSDELDGVKGIGEALAKKIAELHRTGRLEFFEKLRASIEPGLVEMLQIPGLGPKKIRALHTKLGISGIELLTAACQSGKVAELDGFGEKTQEKILAGIANRAAYGRRHLWWDAWETAEPIVGGLRKLPQVRQAEAAGSLRRCLETVGDLDFLVAADESGPIVAWFTALPEVKEVTAKGETKASVRFTTGLQADLRIVPEKQFVFALHHFTGSKDHNVQMRQRALARGLSLSEWGLAPAGGEESVKQKVAGSASAVTQPSNEAELFRLLGLSYIPPELREGMGEIEAAERGELPHLVELADLRGAFHNHTTASDGHNTLAEMAAAAELLGWKYLGIADHSKASFQARGLNEGQLMKQVGEIKALNHSGRCAARIFSGVECDILPDGRLDFEDDVLAALDYVVASVHSSLGQDAATITARTIRAIENPRVTMLGHPTSRLLLRREPSQIELGKVIDAAIERGVVIELNADPHRLDLDWRLWRHAAERGLLCSINPDAHDCEGLKHVRAGVGIARKGWLTAANVLNTRSLAEIAKWLGERRNPTG